MLANDASRRRLGIECIDLYQLHVVDPTVPFEISFQTLLRLQDQGKVREIGLCNIAPEHFRRALSMGRFVSVQGRYSVVSRDNKGLLDLCREHDVAFIPYFPMGGTRGLAGQALDAIASKHAASRRQIGLAWLLQHYPKMLPIPGTADADHLRENLRAAEVRLDPEDVACLDGLGTARS